MSRVYCLHGWFLAFLSWALEPFEDARIRQERRRKRQRKRDAENVIRFGGRRGS